MFQRILKKYLVWVADLSCMNPNWWSQIPFTSEPVQIFYFALCYSMNFRLNWSAETVTWL